MFLSSAPWVTEPLPFSVWWSQGQVFLPSSWFSLSFCICQVSEHRQLLQSFPTYHTSSGKALRNDYGIKGLPSTIYKSELGPKWATSLAPFSGVISKQSKTKSCNILYATFIWMTCFPCKCGCPVTQGNHNRKVEKKIGECGASFPVS